MRIKIFLILVLTIKGISKLEAQSSYRMGIGGVLGNMEGASFKMFFADRLTLQADMGVKFIATQYSGENEHFRSDSFGSIEINPNLMYENKIKAWDSGRLLWLVGMDVSAGYQFENNGKFGANVIGGLEYCRTGIAI